MTAAVEFSCARRACWLRGGRLGLAALLVTALVVGGCTMADTELLESPRIVWIGAEPPALLAPGAAVATVKGFDPEYRVPTVQWYVATTFDLQSQTALAQSLSDPNALDLEALGLMYVGSGTQVTVPVPRLDDVIEIDAAALADEALVDTLPLPLIVSMRWGDTEVKGLKQLRVVIPELVPVVLERQLGRAPTTAEVDAAIALRLNRNPTIAAVTMAVVPDQGSYDLDAIFDLKDRRALQARPVPAAIGFTPNQALRLWPTILDPDLDPSKSPGDPGFNQLNLEILPTVGSVYPLSLSAADWAPHELDQGSVFKEPKIKTFVTGLERLELTVFDRQGGTANVGLETDGGAPPPVTVQGTHGSVLVAEGQRLIWLRADSESVRAAAVPGTAVAISAVLWSLPLKPHGLAGTATAIWPQPTTLPPTQHLQRFDLDPSARVAATSATFVGRILRTWP